MNYLRPLTVITDRLRSVLPETLPVRMFTDLANLKDQALGQPEVFVMFLSDSVQDSAGVSTLIDFHTGVLYLTPSVMADFERDGQVLTDITKALAGYAPPKATGLKPIKRIGSMKPAAMGDTLTGYGLIFTTTGML